MQQPLNLRQPPPPPLLSTNNCPSCVELKKIVELIVSFGSSKISYAGKTAAAVDFVAKAAKITVMTKIK